MQRKFDVTNFTFCIIITALIFHRSRPTGTCMHSCCAEFNRIEYVYWNKIAAVLGIKRSIQLQNLQKDTKDEC